MANLKFRIGEIVRLNYDYSWGTKAKRRGKKLFGRIMGIMDSNVYFICVINGDAISNEDEWVYLSDDIFKLDEEEENELMVLMI